MQGMHPRLPPGHLDATAAPSHRVPSGPGPASAPQDRGGDSAWMGLRLSSEGPKTTKAWSPDQAFFGELRGNRTPDLFPGTEQATIAS